MLHERRRWQARLMLASKPDACPACPLKSSPQPKQKNRADSRRAATAKNGQSPSYFSLGFRSQVSNFTLPLSLLSCLKSFATYDSFQRMAKGNNKSNGNDSDLNFEAQLWAAAEQAVPALHDKTQEFNRARPFFLPISLVAILMLLPRICVNAATPNVPGAITTTYATPTHPKEIDFSSGGTMFTGREECGGCTTDSTNIWRIGIGGSPVQQIGTPIQDPDSVVVDRSGTISGTPGTVLVGGYANSGAGVVKMIMQSGPQSNQVSILLPPTNTLRNPTGLTFDRFGRLLVADGGGFTNPSYPDTGNWGMISNGSFIKLNTNGPARPNHLAMDISNRIVVAAENERNLWLFSSNGMFISSNFVSGVQSGSQAGCQLASANGGFWGTSIYVINGTGNLLKLDLAGHTNMVGTGFDNATGLKFGDDGSLYLSEYANNRILRITPAAPLLALQISATNPAVDLCWNSTASLQYQLQSSPSLNSNQWTNLGSQFQGSGANLCVTNQMDAVNQRFYRLLVQLP